MPIEPIDINVYRRLKTLSLGSQTVLDVLRGCLKVTLNFPEDVTVIAVNGRWNTQGVELLLHSNSFEPVDIGACPPSVSSGMHMKWVKLEQEV